MWVFLNATLRNMNRSHRLSTSLTPTRSVQASGHSDEVSAHQVCLKSVICGSEDYDDLCTAY